MHGRHRPPATQNAKGRLARGWPTTRPTRLTSAPRERISTSSTIRVRPNTGLLPLRPAPRKRNPKGPTTPVRPTTGPTGLRPAPRQRNPTSTTTRDPSSTMPVPAIAALPKPNRARASSTIGTSRRRRSAPIHPVGGPDETSAPPGPMTHQGSARSQDQPAAVTPAPAAVAPTHHAPRGCRSARCR